MRCDAYRHGASPPASFAECWDRLARERGGDLALADSRSALTWRDAADLSRRLARGLLLFGLKAGEVVACWLPNWVDLYVLRIACERAGLIWLPIPAHLREFEVQGILQRAEPSVLVIPEGFRERDFVAAAGSLLPHLPRRPHLVISGGASPAGELTLDQLAQRGDQASGLDFPAPASKDVWVILPTTGTTGLPKFAQFRVSAWLLRGQAQTELLDLRSEDVVVSLSSGIGPSIIPLFAAPLAGAPVRLVDQFEPGAVLEMFRRVQPTIVCGVPAQLTALVRHPGWPPETGLERIRIWYSTGAACPQSTAERLEATTRGISLSGYGGMDFGGWAVPAPSDSRAIRYETVGRPRGHTELRLVDETGNTVPAGEVGEIWGRGPCCAEGYFRDEVATRERWTADGWFRTGDLARRDPSGNLVIMGRKGEVIRRGGRSIHPLELEQLLGAHPKIARVAIVGIPDPLLGEQACAFVVPRPDEVIELTEVAAYLRARRIASFKIPERLVLLPDLPSKGDKVDRLALRETVSSPRH